MDDLFHVPLVGGRGTYVHILANDCPMGVKWSPKDLAGDDISVIDEAIDIAHHKILTVRIHMLIRFWQYPAHGIPLAD